MWRKHSPLLPVLVPLAYGFCLRRYLDVLGFRSRAAR
jgi:hypothetical protein